MPQDMENRDTRIIGEHLERKFNRSQLLKAAGIGAVVAALPSATEAATGPAVAAPPGAALPGRMSFPFLPQVNGTYTTETIPTIINIAQTMEYLATTLVNAGVTNATRL